MIPSLPGPSLNPSSSAEPRSAAMGGTFPRCTRPRRLAPPGPRRGAELPALVLLLSVPSAVIRFHSAHGFGVVRGGHTRPGLGAVAVNGGNFAVRLRQTLGDAILSLHGANRLPKLETQPCRNLAPSLSCGVHLD